MGRLVHLRPRAPTVPAMWRQARQHGLHARPVTLTRTHHRLEHARLHTSVEIPIVRSGDWVGGPRLAISGRSRDGRRSAHPGTDTEFSGGVPGRALSVLPVRPKKGAIAPYCTFSKVLANAPLAKHLFFGCFMEALDFVHV